MRWLKDFFASDDPIVRIAGALSEPEAQMHRERLENDGVPAMVKDVVGGSSSFEAVPPLGFALFVKQSDVERAAEILGPLMDTSQGEDGLSESPDGQGPGGQADG